MGDEQEERQTRDHSLSDVETEDGEGGELGELGEADVMAPARRLGRYTALRLLGQGGMGVVYTAYDELLDRRVAIKLVRTDTRGPSDHARILREAKALAQLAHPNVVSIYEVSADAGRIFLVMEFVPGSTLARFKAVGAESDRDTVLDLYMQAGRGLAAAHAQGLVHRDFKPDNVLVGEDGRARIIDFGLVDVDGHEEATGASRAPGCARLTATGALLGTPAYMSPEQLDGRAVDERSDQFSFCVALFEALTGVRPFAGRGLAERHAAIVAGGIAAEAAALPRWLAAVLRRGLASRPEERYRSMDALLDALAADPAEAARRRRRLALLVVASVAVAVVAALVVVELKARWATYTRERDAELALAATKRRIDSASSTATAREAFAAFVGDPAHDGTDALTRAWLEEAERRLAADELDGARAGFAAAYASATTDARERESLRGLAQVFRRELQWDALAAVMDRLDAAAAGSGPDLAALRVDAGLIRRDLAGAARQASAAGDPRARWIAALRPATATPHRSIIAARARGARLTLVERRGEQAFIHHVGDEPRLPLRETLVGRPGERQLRLLSGEPLYAIGYRDEAPENALYRVDDTELVPLTAWSGPSAFTGATADLDGDGVRELYFATSTDLEIREVLVRPDGVETRVVYTPTDALESLAHGLIATDLDGDGREELAASFSGWWAYDVRILERGGDGRLETRARDKVGTVLGVSPFRGPAGAPRLLAHSVHGDANPTVFPADRPSGDPEGIYLYRLVGDQLRREGHAPTAAASFSDVHWFWPAVVADVDGDGLDDVAINYAHEGVVHLLLAVQSADGGFSQASLGPLQVIGHAQLDDDPAEELLVNVSEGGEAPRLWVLGAGSDVLPAVDAPAPASAEPPAADPAWRRGWQRATTLASLGLDDDAASSFERLARLAADPSRSATAALAAGRQRARLREPSAAIALLHEAAEDPSLRAQALREALDLELHFGAYEAASRTLDQLPDGGDDELARRAALIRRATAERLTLRFDGALDPALTIGAPFALRRDDDAVEIATNDDRVLLSAAVEWSGDLVELAADLAIIESEYGADFDVALLPEAEGGGGEARLAAIHFGVSGSRRGSIEPRREPWCVAGQQTLPGGHRELSSRTDEAITVSVRTSLLPSLGEIGCDVVGRDGAVYRAYHEPFVRDLPAAGRYRLVIRTRAPQPAWVRVRIRELSLRGVRLVSAPPDPRADFHRALVEEDPVAAIAGFRAIPAPTAEDRVGLAHALLGLGRVAAARAIWSDVLRDGGAPPRTLLHLLRAEPARYGPLLREEVGLQRTLALLVAVWAATATNHLDDPRARADLRRALLPLDAEELLALNEPAALADACQLLVWRAQLLLHAGENARARREFERVLAAIERLPPDSPVRSQVWRLWLEFATCVARVGDLDRARVAIAEARAQSPMPALVDDILRAHPELSALRRAGAP